MFGNNKKVKRTKEFKIGGITIRKRVRKATPDERIDNKKSREYYRRNKARIKLKAKLRKQKIEHNPRLKREGKLRKLIEQNLRKGLTPNDALIKAKKSVFKQLNK